MATPEFVYQDPLPLDKDTTKYRLLTKDHVSVTKFEDKEVLKIAPEGLTYLANIAIRDVSFLLRTAHLEKVAAILKDPEASQNDRYVALAMLRNADTYLKAFCRFARTPAPRRLSRKKGSRCGPESKTKNLFQKGFTRPTRRKIFATPRARRSICGTRSIPEPTCRRKSM